MNQIMKSIEATMSVLEQIDVDEIKREKEELPQLNYSKDIPQLKQLFDCNIDDEIQFLAAGYKHLRPKSQRYANQML